MWMAANKLFTKTTLALVEFLTLLLLGSTLFARNMNQVQFNFSLKNIPIPKKEDYLTELISSVAFFVSNLRWRVFHFLNPSNLSSKKETYGFKTTEPAPSVVEIRDFENALYDLVKNVKFKPVQQTNLQTTLKENMLRMNESSNIFVPADKTNNY